MINLALAIVLSLLVTATPNCDEKLIKHLAREAPIIAVAKVEEVEPTLDIGSGYFLVVQRVNYEVEEVLKGELPKGKINVAHFVVANTPTAATDGKQARLSPKLFAKGNRLVLFLETDPQKGYIGIDSENPYKSYLALNENCVPVADVETLKLIRGLISTL